MKKIITSERNIIQCVAHYRPTAILRNAYSQTTMGNKYPN